MYNLFDIWFGLMPPLIAIATFGLIVAEYTPVFEVLSYPLAALLSWLQIPDAGAAVTSPVGVCRDVSAGSHCSGLKRTDPFRDHLSGHHATDLYVRGWRTDSEDPHSVEFYQFGDSVCTAHDYRAAGYRRHDSGSGCRGVLV